MTGYPWYAGETLTAADLNAAFGAVSWHAGSVTALGSNLTLTTGTLAATVPVISVAGRIGAVTLAVADVSGAAPLASPTFTGTVTAATVNVGAFTATGITASPISGSTGSFTTLAASSTVSGTGFSTYLASPPAIGGTAAAAGSFTTLAATTSLTIGLAGGGANLINAYAAAGNNRLMQYFSGANLRWAHGANNTAETGSNAGSNWEIYAYSDASGFLSTPISITRSTGVVTMSSGATITGGSSNNHPIGATTASTGAFTTLSASSTVSGAGFTTLLSPYAPLASPTFTGTVTAATTNVGAFTATGITASPISGSTGSFTTLAASSTVSGTGFSTYLASPPAIGGSAAAAGSFTTLAASSTVSGAGFTTLLAPYAPLASPTFTGTVTAGATNVGAFTATGITASPISGSTGSFTTLAASSTVSGTGFSTYLASPPAIGGTAAAAGKFTTLQATSTITPSSTSGIVGTTTNDSANAGSVGEYISSTVLTGSAVSLTTATNANITSISLTAGDWDVSGVVSFNMAATTSVQQYQVAVSTTSATLPTVPPWARQNLNVNPYAPGAISAHMPTGVIRMSLSGTTTVYLVAQSTFTVSTMAAYGFIAARRMR
jgi:hypothetical protein